MTSLVVHFCSAPLVCFVDALDTRVYDWATVDIRPLRDPGKGYWLLARRSIAKPGVFSVNYFCRFRQLFLPVHPLFLTALLGHSGAVAGDVEFQDDRVVGHPVDGRRRGHWVGEDVLPLGEDQVGRDAQGPAFRSVRR